MILVVALLFQLPLLLGFILLIYHSFPYCQSYLLLHKVETLRWVSKHNKIGLTTSIEWLLIAFWALRRKLAVKMVRHRQLDSHNTDFLAQISTRQLYGSEFEFFRRNDRGVHMPLGQNTHLQEHYENPSHLSNRTTPSSEPENRTPGGTRKRVPIAVCLISL